MQCFEPAPAVTLAAPALRRHGLSSTASRLPGAKDVPEMGPARWYIPLGWLRTSPSLLAVPEARHLLSVNGRPG
jgi:hypothetical protein